MVTVRIPAPSSELITNLLGVAGLVAVVVAVGLLAGFAWALLSAGLICVGLSVLSATAQAKAAEQGKPARPVALKAAAS